VPWRGRTYNHKKGGKAGHRVQKNRERKKREMLKGRKASFGTSRLSRLRQRDTATATSRGHSKGAKKKRRKKASNQRGRQPGKEPSHHEGTRGRGIWLEHAPLSRLDQGREGKGKELWKGPSEKQR